MVKLCFTYRAEPNRTIEARRGISLELQTEDVYTELGTDPVVKYKLFSYPAPEHFIIDKFYIQPAAVVQP